MRELSFAEVRAAGLPARVELADMTYEYRPLLDGVAVRVTSARPSFAGTTHRMPERGWLHKRDCPCSYCQTGKEARR
jgi:hypothetical protein